MPALPAAAVGDKPARHEWMAATVSKSIADQIKALRIKHGLSQTDLAEALGTKQSVVSLWESGTYTGYTSGTLIRLAKFFDCALIIRFVGWDKFMAFTPDGLMAPDGFDLAELSAAFPEDKS
jgi:transcriptional regulator with XRE-family HTH domain